MPDLFLLGCDHSILPPSRLETAVAIDAATMLARLLEARAADRISGAICIRTCNRLELIVSGDDGARAFAEELLGSATVPWVRASGRDVVERLLRIATGLESMVLGEEQILGQVARSFKQAEDAGLLSRPLHMLRNRVLSAARQLRSELPAAGPSRSVAALGIDRMLDALGPQPARIGVLGAGDTARLALDILRRRKRPATLVINRTKARAVALAQHFDCAAQSLAEFAAAPPALDALLCAIDAPTAVVAPAHAAGLRVVLDLSRPSVVHPDVRTMPDGPQVVDLDDLASQVAAGSTSQQAAAATLGQLVQARVAQIWQHVGPSRQRLGHVVELHVESALAEAEQAFRAQLRHLQDHDRERVRELMLRVAKQHAHYHILDLRQTGIR